MPHDPPKGAEKKIIKRLNVLSRKVDRLKRDPPWYSIVTPGHALEGVRTNGTQKLNGLPVCLSELEEFVRELRQFQKKWNSILKAAENELQVVKREVIKHLKACPKCKGKQGYGQCGSNINRWRDCEHCEGRGYIIL